MVGTNFCVSASEKGKFLGIDSKYRLLLIFVNCHNYENPTMFYQGLKLE